MKTEYQNENFNGTYDFRCRYHDGWMIDQHIHEYSEILYCKDGTCEVIVNGRNIILSKGQFVWIPPNYVHQYKKTSAKLICAVFSADLIPLFFHLTEGNSLVAGSICADELSDVFEKLPASEGGDLLQICGYLYLICAKVIKSSRLENGHNCDGALYEKVISYIKSNFRENITLKKLATELGYNEKYLSHAVHSMLNINFTEIVAAYRIEYAKKIMLSDKNASISEIAFLSGFNAINTFNRKFKKATDMTPTQYKNMFREAQPQSSDI